MGVKIFITLKPGAVNRQDLQTSEILFRNRLLRRRSHSNVAGRFQRIRQTCLFAGIEGFQRG